MDVGVDVKRFAMNRAVAKGDLKYGRMYTAEPERDIAERCIAQRRIVRRKIYIAVETDVVRLVVVRWNSVIVMIRLQEFLGE